MFGALILLDTVGIGEQIIRVHVKVKARQQLLESPLSIGSATTILNASIIFAGTGAMFSTKVFN